jgi:hypothetical protein
MAQQPCLPVSRRRKRDDGAGTGFDDIQLMDATSYLSRVVSEANRLPEISVATTDSRGGPTKRKDHIPIEGSAASLLYLTSKRAAIQPPPTSRHVPEGTAWVDQTLENFSRLRLYLEQCRSHGVGGKEANRISVPPLKDRPSWHIFCVGPKLGSGFDDDSDDSDTGSKLDEIKEPWEESLPPEGYSPTVSLLLQMDQVMIRRVLGNLVYYVREGWSSTCPQRAAWIYSLLARLEVSFFVVIVDLVICIVVIAVVVTFPRAASNLSPCCYSIIITISVPFIAMMLQCCTGC